MARLQAMYRVMNSSWANVFDLRGVAGCSFGLVEESFSCWALSCHIPLSGICLITWSIAMRCHALCDFRSDGLFASAGSKGIC